MHPIARYRLARGFTQGALAERLGVNINSVQGWERGSIPRGARLKEVAEALGVDSLQLLGEIEAWKAAKAAA